MRVIIQRVCKASVEVGGEIVGEIGRGICCLVGIHRDDTPEDAKKLAKKILSLRLFPDSSNGDKPWAKSVTDEKLDVLLVSQFTLYAVVGRGTKPDFHLAMNSELSKPFFDEFVAQVRRLHAATGARVETGSFGAMMQVHIQNDGPVTIDYDTRGNGSSSSSASSSEKKEEQKPKQPKAAQSPQSEPPGPSEPSQSVE